MDKRQNMAHRYHPTDKGGEVHHQHRGKNPRAIGYAKPRESTPSPLRNIQYRRWYERSTMQQKKEDFSVNEQNTVVGEDAPAYPKHLQVFDGMSQTERNKPGSRQVTSGGLPHNTNCPRKKERNFSCSFSRKGEMLHTRRMDTSTLQRSTLQRSTC